VPKAIVDPEELNSFALELKRFNTELQSLVASMQRRFGRLGESWQDEQHAKFAAVLNRILGTHARLADASEQCIPLLSRKAQKIEDYLGPRTSSTKSGADISSPDIIREFRTAFLKFEDRSKQAVSGVRTDCDRVLEWLRHEQLSFLKQELRKCEETVRQARSEYLLARHGADALRKPSYSEEEKALRKAEQHKHEIEDKIEAVKRWIPLLEQQTRKLMGPVNSLGGILDSTAPMIRARLDVMAQCLDDYLRESPADIGV